LNHKNIEIQKVESLYNALLSPLLAIFVLSFIIYYSFNGLVPQDNLNIWLILNMLLLLLRVFSYLSYKKTKVNAQNVQKFYRCFFILSTISAVLWGSSAFFILPNEVEYRILILLFITGIISGGTISLAPKVEILYVYLYLILVPYLYVFFIEGSEISKAYTFAIFLYLIIISSIAKKISKALNDNIILAFEKEDLVNKLVDKIEEATSASKAKSDFLSVMSHEIRTPLNAIIGFVNILKKSEEDEIKYKYLDTIGKSSNILTNVINDILDISKIESGKFTLENTEFSPQEEFNSLFELFKQNAQEKGVTLVNNISTNLPQTLLSDILRVKQIISNLLSNAIKFTPIGKTIYLEIYFDNELSSLHVSVKDEGIGISKENLLLVTEAFTQADASTAREYGGTGLGLSIVTNLLKLLNSKIDIKSELGQGSDFSFDIKMQKVETSVVKDQEEEEPLFPTKKILVAEDNKTNQMLISILLEDMEIDVTIADDGLIAETLFKDTHFDMVLMDINMPNKNGIEAMKAIKEYEEENNKKRIPIIALTANAISGDRQKYIADGFDEYIAKPLDIKELEKILKLFFE